MDFDGDGRLDLLSGSNCCDSLGFHLFRRRKDGSWAPRERLELKLPGFPHLAFQESFVTAADWNGDGVPDLLSVGPYGQGIRAARGPLEGKEPITLGHALEIDWERKGGVCDFAVADWDRDGKLDLLVRHQHPDGKGGIYCYKNLGGPGLPRLAEGRLLVEITPGGQVSGFCVGDWNGDGWPDLIVGRVEPQRGKDQDQSSPYRGSVWLYLRE